MNLQTIQKRVEELTAELLTISNDLAFLISGDVQRQPPAPVRPLVYTSFLYAEEGDKVKLTSLDQDFMLCPDFDPDLHTVYEVIDRESGDYTGDYNVLIRHPNGVDAVWVNYTILVRVEG